MRRLLRPLRLALAQRQLHALNSAYVAYMGQPAGQGWSFHVACAMRARLIDAERRVSALIREA